jgi:serine protease Do
MRTKHVSINRVLMVGAIVLIAVAALLYSADLVQAKSGSGFLGVYIGDKVVVKVKEGEKYDTFGGAHITIVDGGPADEAGLEDGDIIIKFDGKDIEDSSDLRRLIRKTDPGDKVDLVVIRDDAEKTFTVTMGERESRDYYAWDDDDLKRIIIPKAKGYWGSSWCDRPWMGIEMQGLSDQLREYFKVGDDTGVLISEVIEDSPAEKAGLKAGDVIIEMNGDDIESSSDVIEVIEDMEVEDEVSVVVMRNKKKKTYKVTLGERPDKWAKGRTCLDYEDFHIKGLEGLKGLHDIRILEDDIKLDELKEKLKDIDMDVQVDMEQLKKEMEKLKEELENLKEKVK